MSYCGAGNVYTYFDGNIGNTDKVIKDMEKIERVSKSDYKAEVIKVCFGADDLSLVANDEKYSFVRPCDDNDFFEFHFLEFLMFCKDNYNPNKQMRFPADVIRCYYGKSNWTLDEIKRFIIRKNEIFERFKISLAFEMVVFGSYVLDVKNKEIRKFSTECFAS